MHDGGMDDVGGVLVGGAPCGKWDKSTAVIPPRSCTHKGKEGKNSTRMVIMMMPLPVESIRNKYIVD